MARTPCRPRVSLREVKARVHDAQHVMTGICMACPAVAGWSLQVRDSLADIPPMAAEIGCLRRDVAFTRLDRANLAAAIRAAIAARADGDDDPFSYVRDELDDQGYADPAGRA